jgi:magnesium-protoporphyrin IX monomethyl ester (oxidative) cyclase
MTKVLLINPPQKYFKQSMKFCVYVPVSLLSIAVMIKDICVVKILDCLVKDFKIKRIKDFTLYGTSFERIETEIKRFNPNIVGITIPFSAQSENAKIISKICKKTNSKIKVVFGGPHSSVKYKELLKEGFCDFCVVGEGEETFFEFIKNLNSKSFPKNIKGLAYKENNKIYFKPRKFIKNLDSLPFPAYELINMEDYQKNSYLYNNRSYIHKNSISMITSRGCPYNCVFCSIHLHMGHEYRYHSPDYIINHIKFLIKRYNIKNFHFEDDNLSLDKDRFEQILDKIIQNNLNINWDTPNGIRVDTLDFNLLKKIKKSGCKCLTIAIESGNQYVLNNIIKKNTSLDYMIKIIKYCKKLKINTGAFYVIGFPGETINNMKETIDTSIKLFRLYDIFPMLLIATPLYGTELYNTCIKEKLIKRNLTDKELSTATQIQGNPLISTSKFSKEDIIKLVENYKLKINKEINKKRTKNIIIHPLETIIKIIKDPTKLKRMLEIFQLLKSYS